MSQPTRSYIGYVDDSGNEDLGLLWVALLIPFDQWTEYLRRWLGFRKNLYAKTRVPASHELHAQVWLSPDPLQETEPEALDALRRDDGELPDILLSGKPSRRERSRWYEKALQTIGTFTEARLLTVYTSEHSGPAKIALYDELLCFIEEFLAPERGHATLLVDGAMDSGSHLRAAHRARRVGASGATTTPPTSPTVRASGSRSGVKSTSPGLPGLVSDRTVGSPVQVYSPRTM